MQDIQPPRILILTITKVEAQAVLETFSKAADKKWMRLRIGNKTYYDLNIHGGAQIYMVQSEMGTATPGGALITVRQAIEGLQPQAIIMCGIAFGLRQDKQQLGDILISKQIQYYESQKIDLKRGQIPRGDRSTASERLLDRFRSGDNDWHGPPTHFGLVLSGEKLVNDLEFRDWLLETEPEAIGGEMEGAGLYTAARDAKTDWILVKAICDWGDGRKNDQAQPMAAKNAAQFVSHVLQQGGWANFEIRKSPPISAVTYSVFVSSPSDVMDERQIVYDVLDDVNKTLRTMKDLMGLRIILDPLTWEKDVFPNVGNPQITIKQQIPYDKCDIFIGIFWKRFGTPTGTIRPRDGKPYISGTQQEIEEAMEHREHFGSPVIMLYRKDEPPIPAPKSDEDREQLREVRSFFRECETKGSHPALVNLFKSNTFREELRDHLLKTVSFLQRESSEAIKLSPEPFVSETKYFEHRAEVPNWIDEVTDYLAPWCKKVDLREYPFRDLYAEFDRELLKYFARFQQIRALTKAEIFQDHYPWVFVGDLGAGKTALRKLLASWGSPNNPQNDILCLEYGRDEIQETLSEADQLSDFVELFFQDVYQRVANRQRMLELPTLEWQPTDDFAGSLVSLSQALQACGVNRVICLVDPDSMDFELNQTQVSPHEILGQLMKIIAVFGVGFCYFLPLDVKRKLDKSLSRLHSRVIEIHWTVDDLLGLISRRMTACSNNQLSPYRSLGQLCEDDRDFASLVDRKIVNLAEGSPRGVIALAHHMIELHVQDFPQRTRISPKTWDEVEMDWWWQRRNTILGISGRSLWIKDNQIFYGNRKLILSDIPRRLLQCLIQGSENFATKETLKQAGWPEDLPQGVSDEALREVIRRLREELKEEFKNHHPETPPSIKSVRGQGYRLFSTGSTKREEKKGEE